MVIEALTDIVRSFLLESIRTRGGTLCLLTLLLFAILPSRLQSRVAGALSYRHDLIAIILFAVSLLIGVLYLPYPNFLDHVESTIATLGEVMHDGAPVYPWPDPYPYHGILYGPVLAEIQALCTTEWLSPLASSKIPGVVAYFFSVLILLHLTKTRISRGYLLYLLPFGLMLFWNRGEPFLLLAVSLSLWLGSTCRCDKLLPIIFGLIAGFASAIKLHGVLYVLAAYIAIAPDTSKRALLLFTASCATSFSLFFIPANISHIHFVDYLRLASNHGLSLRMWVENLVYLAIALLPLVIVTRKSAGAKKIHIAVALIAVLEFIVTIIAAKPGAGVHHLLPFLPINTYLLSKMSDAVPGRSLRFIHLIYTSLLVPTLAVTIMLIMPLMRDWNRYEEARNEVSQYKVDYPNLVMGVAGDMSYPYTFFRVLLQKPQIDFPAYMDLQLSGIDATTFESHVQQCHTGPILIPVGGEPFSVSNYYTGKPLFSDRLRTAFSQNYRQIESGKYYTVYRCKSKSLQGDNDKDERLK